MKYLIYIFIILISFSCKDTVEKKEINEEAARLNGDAVQTYVGSRDSGLKAIKLIDKALEIEPNYIMALTNKASFQIGIGQIDEAITTYKKIEKIQPNSEETKFMIGLFYYTKGDTISANKKYNEVNELCQTKLDTLSNGSKEEFRIKTNKAIVLKILYREKEANELFRSIDLDKVDLSEELFDETQKEFLQEAISKYIKLTPKEFRERHSLNWKSEN